MALIPGDPEAGFGPVLSGGNPAFNHSQLWHCTYILKSQDLLFWKQPCVGLLEGWFSMPLPCVQHPQKVLEVSKDGLDHRYFCLVKCFEREIGFLLLSYGSWGSDLATKVRDKQSPVYSAILPAL